MGIRYGQIKIRNDDLTLEMSIEINKLMVQYQKIDDLMEKYFHRLAAVAGGADGLRTLALCRTHLEQSSMYASKTVALQYEVNPMSQQIIEKDQKPYSCPHPDSDYLKVSEHLQSTEIKNEHMCGKCGAKRWI